MASDSEHCVDELVKLVNQINELTAELESTKSDDLLALSKTKLREAQLYIDNNKPLVPSFTLKRVTDSLNRLKKQVESIEWANISFKFSEAKSNVSDEKKPEQNNEVRPEPIKVSTPTNQAFLGFRDESGQRLELRADEVDLKDVKLVNLTNCSVRIVGFSNTVYIRGLKDSDIVVCLACRAITIADSQNCNFRLVCQQLRIDSNIDCSYSIYASARPMLESSRGLTFKMLDVKELAKEQDLNYEELKNYLIKANFKESENKWRCIDDFDWLSPESPSINFRICE